MREARPRSPLPPRARSAPPGAPPGSAARRAFAVAALAAACGADPAGRALKAPEAVTPGDSAAPAEAAVRFSPPAARLLRLTDPQLRNAYEDLLGLRWEGALPLDYDLHGYITVGASEVSFAPYDLELVEAAAWSLAEAAVPDAAARDARLGCAVAAPPTDPALGPDLACARAWAARFTAEAWRRPVEVDEVEALVALFDEVADAAGPTLAARAVIAATLLSPDFLFRAELGAPHPSDPGRRRLSDHELAVRLAFFVTDAPPDAELRADADAGRLQDRAAVRAHAERLLDTPRAREALTRFFAETLDLARIATVEKDPVLFPEDSPALRAAMRAELEALFQEVALDSDLDLRTLLTTEATWVDPLLAQVYELDGWSGTGWTTLPPGQDRGGLLGRAGFLALNAASTRTSPTHRGKFVRTRLLCQDIPPPPEGVVASLEGVDSSGTLRDTLEQHMSDPACSSCHLLMDPLGFPLEHFDAIGRWRELDNGLPIDASGELSGVAIDGGAALGRVVAADPAFGACMSRQLLRHATAGLEGSLQEPAVDALTAHLEAGGHRFQALVLALVESEAFRTASAPISGACAEADEGATRACETACGAGVEVCVDGAWSGCDAPPAPREACDGVDNDCDGVVDEVPLRSCDGGAGVQVCEGADWSTCARPAPATEVCDGADNDENGLIDDVPEVVLTPFSFAALRAAHEACEPAGDTVTGPCNAATNRACAASGCGAVTGLGPLGVDLGDDVASLACLNGDAAQVFTVSFAALQAHHAWCDPASPVSADCNASIGRWCAAQGLTTGFGPLEHGADIAIVACTPTASTHTISYDELTALQPDCVWPETRNGAACKLAIHQWCAAGGAATGHGPLENWDNLAVVACLPPGAP